MGEQSAINTALDEEDCCCCCCSCPCHCHARGVQHVNCVMRRSAQCLRRHRRSLTLSWLGVQVQSVSRSLQRSLCSQLAPGAAPPSRRTVSPGSTLAIARPAGKTVIITPSPLCCRPPVLHARSVSSLYTPFSSPFTFTFPSPTLSAAVRIVETAPSHHPAIAIALISADPSAQPTIAPRPLAALHPIAVGR